ncbi:hypothetical protein PI124_g4677 [Phytophthora idaei]|nr:hypothetical protein PI126_g2528 [Phytophthora idaei]KAG3250662.1 hypothetical protein PI124_g4677 [Phytophthora idaei]
MSLNVAGLPEILSSGNPLENSVKIGKRISRWDVVNVQEDFNYHAYTYSENSHLYRTATSGGIPPLTPSPWSHVRPLQPAH